MMCIDWNRVVGFSVQACPETYGWQAWIGDIYIGTVWADGSAVFGDRDTPTRGIKHYGSQPLAADALVRYVEGGGR